MRMSPVTSPLLTASRVVALAPLPSAAASFSAFSAVLQSQIPLHGQCTSQSAGIRERTLRWWEPRYDDFSTCRCQWYHELKARVHLFAMVMCAPLCRAPKARARPAPPAPRTTTCIPARGDAAPAAASGHTHSLLSHADIKSHTSAILPPRQWTVSSQETQHMEGIRLEEASGIILTEE